jgi:glycine betaine catabolism A
MMGPTDSMDAIKSPIDPQLLTTVLAPLGESRTLPGQAYTSNDVLAWERERFFEASWVCVGRSDLLSTPGDQRAVQVGREGILLTRDEAGRLHGFFNVCRHRGHELLGCGQSTNLRAIRCPYHAWVYGLDGSLRGTPRFTDLPDSDPVREGLAPARVAESMGWIFVNVSGDAPDLQSYLGNLTEVLEPYGPERLRPAASHEYEIEANWKVVVENYHECYHCPQIHPELCRVTPPSSGDSAISTGLWVGGSMDLREHADTMSLSGQSGGIPIPGLDEARLRQVSYFGLFPALLISPHPDYVMTHRIEPVTPSRSWIECQWLFPPEAMERPGFDPSYAVEFWDITNRQDWRACVSVQRGVSSRAYAPGPLARDEDNVHQFLTMVAAGYLAGRPAHPAPPSRVTAVR